MSVKTFGNIWKLEYGSSLSGGGTLFFSYSDGGANLHTCGTQSSQQFQYESVKQQNCPPNNKNNTY